MKKILLILTLAIVMVSCRQINSVKTNDVQTDWNVVVYYIDSTVDTIVIRSYRAPILYASTGVGYLSMGDTYEPAVCYVKKIKILNKDENIRQN